jgi:hypothetical protein
MKILRDNDIIKIGHFFGFEFKGKEYHFFWNKSKCRSIIPFRLLNKHGEVMSVYWLKFIVHINKIFVMKKDR